MGDFFTVGEHYANRLGEYEVMEVATPVLKIKYTETGRVQEVEEELQERIVRNLQREIALANAEPEERKAPTKSTRTRRKRAKFEGFNRGDFDGDISGTSWRAKTGLGGLLAQNLTDKTGEALDSWAPNRQTACFITSPEEASSEFQSDSAQFFVLTAPSGLTYGLSIHRPADAAEGSTAWDRLLTTLGEEDTVAAQLNDLLTSGNVELSWYGEAWGEAERETVRGDDDGLQLDRGTVTESDSIDAVLERLNEAPQDQALILTVEAGMAVDDAIAAGPGLADTITDLLEQLMGLYQACKG